MQEVGGELEVDVGELGREVGVAEEEEVGVSRVVLLHVLTGLGLGVCGMLQVCLSLFF